MFLKISPRDAKPSNVHMDEHGNPDQENVREAAQRLVSIRIELTKPFDLAVN